MEQQSKNGQREDVSEVAQVSGPAKQSVVIGGGGGYHGRAHKVLIHVLASRQVGNKARLRASNSVTDPVLVVGHFSVDPGFISLGTASTKTDDSTLNPDGTTFKHQGSAWVSLEKKEADLSEQGKTKKPCQSKMVQIFQIF